MIAAVGLAILAAAGNYFYLTSRTSPTVYVRFKADVPMGDIITKEVLEWVAIPGDDDELLKSLIPWRESQSIEGRTANRDFKRNSLALAQDFAASEPKWKVFGPFKLLSVGERILDAGSNTFSDGSAGQTITIEAEIQSDAKNASKGGKPELQEYNPQFQQLLDIIYRSRGSKESVGRIVAIQVMESLNESESNPPAGGQSELSIGNGKGALIVPLTDIVTIPEVLVRGSKIGFVVKL